MQSASGTFSSSNRELDATRLGQLMEREGHLHGNGHRDGLSQVHGWTKRPLRKRTLRRFIEAGLEPLKKPDVVDGAIAVDDALSNNTTLGLRTHRLRRVLCVYLVKDDWQLHIRVARAVYIAGEAICRRRVARDDQPVGRAHSEGLVSAIDGRRCRRHTHLPLLEPVFDP